MSPIYQFINPEYSRKVVVMSDKTNKSLVKYPWCNHPGKYTGQIKKRLGSLQPPFFPNVMGKNFSHTLGSVTFYLLP